MSYFIARRFWPSYAVALAVTVLVSAAQAQTYPDRRITMTVGFTAGSGADILARYYAAKLADETGQTVIVENKPGANGNIAAQAVKQAKPDGYTLLFSPSAAMAGNSFMPTCLTMHRRTSSLLRRCSTSHSHWS